MPAVQLREHPQSIESNLHPGLPRNDWYGKGGQVTPGYSLTHLSKVLFQEGYEGDFGLPPLEMM
jgi:hypothetical protein